MTVFRRCISFARLARVLIRERRENPLVEFGRPMRTVGRQLKFWGVVIVAWVVAFGLLGVVMETVSSDAPTAYFALTLGGMPWAVFLIVYLFGHSLRERKHLEDLHLTALSRQEIVFGAVWWPLVVSALAYCPFLWFQAGLEAMAPGARPIPESLGRLLISVSVFVYVVALTVCVWIDHGPKFLVTFSRAFVSHSVSGIFWYATSLLCALPLIFWSGAASGGSQPEVLMGGILLGWLWVGTLAWAYRVCRFAGNRFFAAIDPEALARESWHANEQAGRTEKAGRREALRRLRVEWVRDLRCDWKGIVAGMGLAFGLALAVALIRQTYVTDGLGFRILCGLISFPSVAAVSLYVIVFAIGFRTRGRKESVLPVAAGSILKSAERYVQVPMAAPASLWILVVARDTLRRSNDLLELILFFLLPVVLITLFVLLQLGATILLAPQERRRRVSRLILLAGFLVQSIPLLGAKAPPDGEMMFYDVEEAIVPWLLLMAAGLAAWTALGTGWSLQRLHDQELKGLPRHRLTSEGRMVRDTDEPAGPERVEEETGERAGAEDSPQLASEHSPS